MGNDEIGKNKARVFDGSKYNMWQVADMANCYYELSKTFTSNIPTTPANIAKQHFLGGASATNRILALELYFKALLVGQQGSVPMDHDLMALFNALPAFFRREIERMFDKRATYGFATSSR